MNRGHYPSFAPSLKHTGSSSSNEESAGVGVFQFESPVLLDGETVILNLPATTSTLVGYRDDAIGLDREIGEPP